MCDGTRADENKRYHEKSSISACFLQGKLKYDFLQEINSLHHKPFPSDKKKYKIKVISVENNKVINDNTKVDKSLNKLFLCTQIVNCDLSF